MCSFTTCTKFLPILIQNTISSKNLLSRSKGAFFIAKTVTGNLVNDFFFFKKRNLIIEKKKGVKVLKLKDLPKLLQCLAILVT